jgi:anti-sigma regulatory factor (Ser/Thr protein kinase)
MQAPGPDGSVNGATTTRIGLARLGLLRRNVGRAVLDVVADDGIASRAVSAVHELCTNAIVHGARGGDVDLCVRVGGDPDRVTVRLSVDGPPFDTSLGSRLADGLDPLDPRPGRLGLRVVGDAADTVDYRRAGRTNITTLTFVPRS